MGSGGGDVRVTDPAALLLSVKLVADFVEVQPQPFVSSCRILNKLYSEYRIWVTIARCLSFFTHDAMNQYLV